MRQVTAYDLGTERGRVACIIIAISHAILCVLYHDDPLPTVQ